MMISDELVTIVADGMCAERGGDGEVDVREYVRILRKNWWIVVVFVLLGVGGGLFVNLRAVPEYQSTVTFYVSTPSSTTTGNSALQANQYALDKMDSYTKLLTSDALAALVIEKSGLAMSIPSVTGRISATSDLNTVLLEADVTDEDPNRSFELARAVSTEFGVLVDQLDNRTVDGVSGSTVKMNVVSGPTLNPVPISPRKNLNLGIGFAVGLLVGAALALARGLLDTTIRSAEDLGKLLRIPVLGTVGFESAARKYPVLVASQQRSIRAESFRQLRTNLQFMNVDNPVKTLVVTSSVAGEGKSTTSTNLALVYAETGRKVLLIEADMRRGRVAEYLGLEDAVGLSNVLTGDVDAEDVIQTWGNDQLSVLLRGEAPPNPSEMLGSQHMVELIEKMRKEFDVIIVDAPPLLPVTDAAVASTWADGVLMVVRWGKATRSQVHASMEALDGVDARVLGTALTMRPHRKSDRVKGYQAYGIYDEEEPVKQRRFGKRSKASRDSVSKATRESASPASGDPAPKSARHSAPEAARDSVSRSLRDPVPSVYEDSAPAASVGWVPTVSPDVIDDSAIPASGRRTMGEALGMADEVSGPDEAEQESTQASSESNDASPESEDAPPRSEDTPPDSETSPGAADGSPESDTAPDPGKTSPGPETSPEPESASPESGEPSAGVQGTTVDPEDSSSRLTNRPSAVTGKSAMSSASKSGN